MSHEPVSPELNQHRGSTASPSTRAVSESVADRLKLRQAGDGSDPEARSCAWCGGGRRFALDGRARAEDRATHCGADVDLELEPGLVLHGPPPFNPDVTEAWRLRQLEQPDVAVVFALAVAASGSLIAIDAPELTSIALDAEMLGTARDLACEELARLTGGTPDEWRQRAQRKAVDEFYEPELAPGRAVRRAARARDRSVDLALEPGQILEIDPADGVPIVCGGQGRAPGELIDSAASIRVIACVCLFVFVLGAVVAFVAELVTGGAG